MSRAIQIAFPLLLGSAILIWTYHGFDFGSIGEVLSGGINYSLDVVVTFFRCAVTPAPRVALAAGTGSAG